MLLFFTAATRGSANPWLPGVSLRDEAIELGAAAGVAAFTEFYFSKTPVWTNVPLLGTQTRGPYKTETVSDAWLFPLGFSMAGGIGLLPNSGGWLDRQAYIHAKGFLETSFSLMPLLDETVKHIAGKKRPDYDAALALHDAGENIDVNDLRKSFWSGQASMSFGMATYFDLFLFRNVMPGDASSLFWKLPLALGACATATYISYTRVADYVHEPVDVIVGGLAGALTATGMYFLDKKRVGNKGFGVDRSPGKIGLSYRF